ncbi:MAG TPA: tetratricopeptide repeat protein [Ohtaekwangia sp.]
MIRLLTSLIFLSAVFRSYGQTDSLTIKQADSVKQQAQDQVSAKQYKEAISTLQKAIALYEETNHLKGQLASYYSLSEAYFLNYDDSLALSTLTRGEQLALAREDSFMLCKLSVRHANYLYRLGYNQQALAMNKETIALAKACNDIVDESFALSNMGLVLKDMGEYDRALEVMYETLRLRESNPKFSKKDVSSILLNIGYVLDVLKRSDEALGYYRRALQLKMQDGDSLGMARVYSNMAVIHKNRKEYETALVYIDSSNQIYTKAGLPDEFYVNYTNMGSIYKRMGDALQGELYYKKALDIAIRTHAVQYEGDTYLNLAALFSEQKTYDKSISYLQKALSLTDYTKSPLSKYEVYGGLSEAYAGAGKMKDAYENLLLANQYRDSVFRQEQLKVIEETKASYETEKKEQQIALQQEHLAEQRAQLRQTYSIIILLTVVVILVVIIFILVRGRFRREQKLLHKAKELSIREAYIEAYIQSQENERKRFAQDLHDGMGQLLSSLRLVLGTVSPQSTTHDRVQVMDKAEHLLQDMHREIRSIAFNLMPQTLIQSGLIAALKEMAARLNHSTNVTINVGGFDLPDKLSEVQEISLYRIVQEWVNNVIKYAAASVIEIQFVGHDEEISLTIEDNGRGFDPGVLEHSEGNGWKNIRSRSNLLKGEIFIDSKAGQSGTTFMIRLPVMIREETASLSEIR